MRYQVSQRPRFESRTPQERRPVPGKKGLMGEDAVEQYIPKQYNEETTLSADVARGKTEHNFDLKK